MWMKGSSRLMSTPAKARRTGKPSPSKPCGALVTERTGRWRSVAASRTRSRVVTSSTVMAGIGKTSNPSNVFDSATIPGQLFLVTGLLRQCLLNVAGPPRNALTRLVARTRDVAEPERLARPARLDVPALATLAAGQRGHERVDDPVHSKQRHPDRGQRLSRLRRHDVGVGEPRTDRIDEDALAGVRRTGGAHQSDDAVLVRAVQGVERRRDQTGEAGRRDDLPAAILHGTERRVHAEHNAVEVDAHRLPVAVEVEVVADSDAAGDAGVEERDVEAPVQLDDAPNGGHVFVVRRNVTCDECAADLGRYLLAVVGVDVTQHDVGAEAAESARHTCAEAAGATRDPGDLPVIALRASVIALIGHPKICFVIDFARGPASSISRWVLSAPRCSYGAAAAASVCASIPARSCCPASVSAPSASSSPRARSAFLTPSHCSSLYPRVERSNCSFMDLPVAE